MQENEILQYQSKLEAIAKNINQLYCELKYIIRNSAIRLTKLQTVTNNIDNIEQLASFFLFKLNQLAVLFQNGIWLDNNFKNKLSRYYFFCRKSIYCRIKLSELELVLSDAYLDDEFVRERTSYLKKDYLDDFLNIDRQIKQVLNEKYNTNLQSYFFGPIQQEENKNIATFRNDGIIPPDITTIEQSLSNCVTMLDNVKVKMITDGK